MPKNKQATKAGDREKEKANINAETGEGAGSTVFHYPRWKEGRYCQPVHNQFRQHPLDYIKGPEDSITKALKMAPAGTAEKTIGIAVDTTGSSPAAELEGLYFRAFRAGCYIVPPGYLTTKRHLNRAVCIALRSG